MQSYALPLADFVEVNARFDPTRFHAIHFVFDRTRRGSVLLDAVGLFGSKKDPKVSRLRSNRNLGV